MIALDTNILLYAFDTRAGRSGAAQDAIARACDDERGCGIAVFSIAEFWRTATRPAARPTIVRDAAAFLRNLAEDGGVATWLSSPGFGERLARHAVNLEVRGVGIFDLQIALCALESGATEVWTHDAGFPSLPGLRVVNPL